MTKDEALRLALEALENITSVSICEATHHAKKDRHLLCEECPNEVRHLKAITAIKAALEAKDEPVAWMHIQGNFKEPSYRQLDDWEIQNGWEQYPIYATPPQRKPLTDEEITEIFSTTKGLDFYLNFARAIEQAHGIKGEA